MEMGLIESFACFDDVVAEAIVAAAATATTTDTDSKNQSMYYQIQPLMHCQTLDFAVAAARRDSYYCHLNSLEMYWNLRPTSSF